MNPFSTKGVGKSEKKQPAETKGENEGEKGENEGTQKCLLVQEDEKSFSFLFPSLFLSLFILCAWRV